MGWYIFGAFYEMYQRVPVPRNFLSPDEKDLSLSLSLSLSLWCGDDDERWIEEERWTGFLVYVNIFNNFCVDDVLA